MEKSLDLQVEMAKSGYPTLKISYDDKTLYLHSKYNPIREAETWAKEFYEPGKLFILIGLGLGYYAKELLKIMDANDRILIIEPYEKILTITNDHGLAELLADPRVFICLQENKNNLGQILRILIQQKFLQKGKLFVTPNYDKIANVESIIADLKKAFEDYAVDINTKVSLAFDWQRNYFRNMKYAAASCPITAFEKKFTCPAVIVSAGPSLQKELEKLKTVYQHAIIISAGSATPVLLKNGVKPHMVVSIDGSPEMYDHLKDTNYADIPLCYSPNHHYKITENHKGQKIVFQSPEVGIIDWYNEIIGFQTGIVQSGPSVANFCLDVACKLTSGPICFVGQDLGYVGGFSHAEGNSNRVSTTDTKQNLIRIESNDGNELYAEYAFVLMRERFEKYLYVNPRENVYNASLQGARIHGMKVLAFSNFIDDFCQESIDIGQVINESAKEWRTTGISKKVDIDNTIKELTGSLKKMITLAKEASDLSEKLLNKVKKRDDGNLEKILTKLSKIDKKIMSLKNKDGLLILIIQLITDKLIMWDEEDEDDHKKKIKIAEKNHFFYTKLCELGKMVEKIFDDIKAGV